MNPPRLSARCGSALRRELILADTAFRAAPIVWQRFKSRSGRDAVGRIAIRGIIDITADIANVFLHINPFCQTQSMVAFKVKQIRRGLAMSILVDLPHFSAYLESYPGVTVSGLI